MSTEQPGNDPFRKPDEPGGQQRPQGDGGSPYGNPPPPPPPPPEAGGPQTPYGAGGGYQGGPYGSPYGTDPLAGMPPLASRGKRLLARIIDALIIGIPVTVVVGLAQGGYHDARGDTYAQQGVYTLVYLIYEGLMLTMSGQTVGKKLMRIRVAMLQNGAVPVGTPGWFRAAVYSLPALVPCLGFLFWLVNVLFCTWDQPYRQCLHDKAARTVVVAVD